MMIFVTHNTHTHPTGDEKLEHAFRSHKLNHAAVAQMQFGYIHPKHSFMETEKITVSIVNIHSNNYADRNKSKRTKVI